MTSRRSLYAITVSAALLTAACVQMDERNAKSPRQNPMELADAITSTRAIELREIPFKVGNQYNIYVDGEKVGEIKENIFNWGDHFDIYAGNGQTRIGSADQKLLSWGYHTRVVDTNGQVIGELNEKVFTLKPTHQIEIAGPKGNLLMTSNERFFAFPFKADLHGPNDEPYGQSEKAFAWNNYRVSLSENAPHIDGRLLAMLCAAQDKMTQRDAESDSSDDDE